MNGYGLAVFISVLKILGLVLGGLLVGLIVAEAGLRSFDYKLQLSHAWILGSKIRVLNDDVIVIPQLFLDQGFYAAHRSQKSDLLVVALGDSFTEGHPVERCTDPRLPCPRDDSYPGVLERLLNDAGLDAAVVHAGIGDSGPDQQLRFFKDYILPRLSPQIVVWQFYTNDTWDNVKFPTYAISEENSLVPLDAHSNWYYRRLQLFNRIPLPSSVKKRSYAVNGLMQPFEDKRFSQVPTRYGNDPLAWAHDKIALEVKEMQRLARLHNFDVYFVLIAHQARYLTSMDPGWMWNDHWASYEEEYQHLLDLLESQPTFILAEFSAGEVQETTFLPVHSIADAIFAGATRDPMPRGNQHFNEAGNALLAQKVAQRILAP